MDNDFAWVQSCMLLRLVRLGSRLWLGGRRLKSSQLLLRVMVLVLLRGSRHEGGVVGGGCAGVCHGVGAGGLVEDLGHWGRIVEKQHVQVFLQILMCLSLWHHVLLHGDGFVGVVQLVRIENVLGLIQKIAGLRCHVHWRVRAHI